MSSKVQQVKPEIKLISRPLGLAIDGHSININDNNMAEILFFQVLPFTQKENTIDAQGVATLRFTLEQLKVLHEVLGKVIETHEKKMLEKAGKK